MTGHDPITHDPIETSENDVVVLPWWQNPLNFIALGLAALVLGIGIGYYVGDRNASPAYNSTDVGFLQDMRFHHDQAVEMAYFYLTRSEDPHPRLSLIAEEIVLSQQLESGRMIELLRSFSQSEVNDTGQAMSWMGMPVPIDEMPGLATPEQLDQFAAADGDEASIIFARLMITHHRAGITMAEHLLDHGSNAAVQRMAEGMIKGQSAEVAALDAVVQELTAGS